MNSVILGDCLIESDKIESGSVDLILTDLPYGTVTNIANSENCKHGMKNNTSWDLAIEPSKVYEIANRILRKNGRMILFSQEPYSTQLISQAIPNLPFNFRMIWEKDHFANSLIAKKAPVSYYEDILVFSKKNPIHDCEFLHPLREYFQVIYDFIGKNKKQIIEQVGQGADHTFRFGSSQFALCTEKIYNKLIEVFNIDEMEGFKSYSEIKEIDEPFRNNLNNGINSLFPSTFNLWEGKKYKPNILKYKKDYNGYHPTQKPILLLEDLIKTFSNENDLVVDLTAGSGSTAIACINTNRNYILIEKEQTYYNIINERIAKHKEQTDLFKDEIK
jgi:site-specific DNA-methyltransferase (adenine-specific)